MVMLVVVNWRIQSLDWRTGEASCLNWQMGKKLFFFCLKRKGDFGSVDSSEATRVQNFVELPLPFE